MALRGTADVHGDLLPEFSLQAYGGAIAVRYAAVRACAGALDPFAGQGFRKLADSAEAKRTTLNQAVFGFGPRGCLGLEVTGRRSDSG
jgi:hypothetical protein